MGSILITQEGIETSTIDEDKRDESLFNFYMMLEKAVKFGDCCFMTEATYGHKYSYGDYYPAFTLFSWDEFQQIESLKGISQSTYNYITNNFHVIFPKKIRNQEEFERENMPKGEGGFEHSDSSKDFLYNISNWEKWHRDYLTANPKEIQWKSNSHLSNIEVVYKILKEEILKYIERKHIECINQDNDKKQEIERIWDKLFADKKYHKKQNGIALFFHQVVMPSKGRNEMTAYCKEIGKKVCEQNYYQYENELSTNEQRICQSLREIYGIVKNGEKQYISLDFHKGMFEFHDEKGIHLGEYLFDGTFNKKAEKSHDFKTLI